MLTRAKSVATALVASGSKRVGEGPLYRRFSMHTKEQGLVADKYPI